MSDILFYLIYIVVGLAIGVTLWSIARKAIIIGRTSGIVHGIPVRHITWCISVTLICILILSFVFADTTTAEARTSDTLWLRISNMMVVTGLICIIAAIVTIVYSFIHTFLSNRKGVKNLFKIGL